MYQLLGEYECKVDAKGRIRLPSQLVKQLGDTLAGFCLNRGYEKHLTLYPKDVWDKKTKEINQLNINITAQRRAIRYFHRGATKVSLDGQDRILIPKNLTEYAGIKSTVMLSAYNQQVEIWSKREYENMIDSEPDQFAVLTEAIYNVEKNENTQEQ